ncbi:hypothetical protein CRENPOLYSF2_2560030 [Crenothrix polyspora]|uniref:Uncharacterized protein n=1 Tax=Crenothrix polyspora TaxID=360316 RepID=A0A1R4H7D8_9GAMM|nr:hypothetical protein CRENPOLYSF2_2560030 [Crenothrix polyspora]
MAIVYVAERNRITLNLDRIGITYKTKVRNSPENKTLQIEMNQDGATDPVLYWINIAFQIDFPV